MADERKIFSLIQIKSERRSGLIKQNLPGGLSAVVPPDPMPNSEVKAVAPMVVWGLPMWSRELPGIK